MESQGTPSDNCAEPGTPGALAALARPDIQSIIAKVSSGKMSAAAVPPDLRELVLAVAEVVKAVAYRELLSEVEAARRLNVSVKTLQNHRSLKRGIKAVRPLGEGTRSIRYDPLSIAAAMLPDDDA
ncbi:MAG: hypothetical protein B0A82_17430 [Alkalinema sp. CACIAM 70d]|nr:MAG: hypothetical protein B0A82_17430 [Alkalinema sp. CACIAM 70d]